MESMLVLFGLMVVGTVVEIILSEAVEDGRKR